ncbi:endoglin isoform X1 [Cuculus canorus]|uniref:endoglin isoform X1 n=1 Tax=Cuculus canorus TaxID=55661 RepID=UPI0023AAB784|nr:endoglin isoform X1 [Cuculus canorus]
MAPAAAPLLPLLLALLGPAGPGRAEGCDLRPVTAEPPITLSYATSTVTRGCISSSSLGTGHEVHVLNIKWTKVSAIPLKVSVTPRTDGCTRPVVLIIFCSRCLATITSPCPDLLVRNDTHLSLLTTTAPGSEPLVASEGQLLAWAQGTYGGITSYSELRDPRWVQLQLGEDASSPPDCIPREHFNAASHLETEVFFHGVKGCSQEDAQNTRAAHIVRLQPEPSSPITEVNLSLSCPERAASNQIFILQSWANLTWSLSVDKCNIQFLVSGNYKIVSMSPMLIPGELLPDTEQGLIAKAFEKNYSIIASYSIIPVSTHISLEIQEHEMVRKVPVMPTTSAPARDRDTLPRALLLMLQPWKCTDETLEIVIARYLLEPIKDVVNITLRDISCQAEKNATHFMLKTPLSHCGTLLEGRGHANNELILNLAKGAALRSVRVGFQCNIPRELFLRLFPTAAFEAPQTELEVNKEAFVQASMQWEDHPADLQLKECWLVAPGWEPVLLVQGGEAHGAGVAVLEGPPSSHGRKVWRFRFTYSVPEGGRVPFSATLKCKAGLQNNTIFEKVLEVTVKDGWRPPNNRGLGLAAVLGITFGAFLIGALLTAGLWYIYSHTPGFQHSASLGEQQHQPQHRQHSEHPLFHQQHGLSPLELPECTKPSDAGLGDPPGPH